MCDVLRGLISLATNFMLSSTLADFLAARAADPQSTNDLQDDFLAEPEPVYTPLPPHAYSKVLAGEDDFSLNARIGDKPPTMVHPVYGDLNMFQPYVQGQRNPSYDNQYQKLLHELANRMSDEYEFLYPAFEESHELLRRFLTEDGRADGFYNRVTDCKTLHDIVSSELSHIFDDEATEAHWTRQPQFWDKWNSPRDKKENPDRTGHKEYIGGKSYYEIGEFTSKEVNQVLSPWFSFAAEAAHGQIYSREIIGKKNNNRGHFQPTVWPNGFGYGGLQHTYDRLFRDKGYAVDQKNIRPAMKDAKRNDNMDTTEFLIGFFCMQAHHAYELCVAANIPDMSEHFSRSKLPSADFGQEGEFTASQIINQKIAKLREYTEGTVEHAHATLLLEYDIRFRIMLYALPRMHGCHDDEAVQRTGKEGFCRIQHAGNAGQFNTLRESYAIVDQPDPKCDSGQMSRFGFMRSFFWRDSGCTHQDLMKNPSDDFQVGQVDYEQWTLKETQLIPWRVKGIIRNLDMNNRGLSGYLHKMNLDAGITQDKFPRHKCRLRIMNEMLDRQLHLTTSPDDWEIGLVQTQTTNIMIIPFTVQIQLTPSPGRAKPGPLPHLDPPKQVDARDDFGPNPASQRPVEEDWGPARDAPAPPEEGEELELEPVVYEERQGIAFVPVQSEEAGMSFKTTYQNPQGKIKETEFNKTDTPYESQCAVIIEGEAVVHRHLNFATEADEFTDFMAKHAEGWQEKHVRRFITLRYYQIRDQLKQSWRAMINHPLTRQINGFDEQDKFFNEQVRTGQYAQEQWDKRLPTRLANPNPYQTRMLSPNTDVFILARSSTEQMPKYCWFGSLSQFEAKKSEMEQAVAEKVTDATTPEDRQLYEKQAINRYLQLRGTDSTSVPPTQKAVEIPANFAELFAWTFVDEKNVEKGVFIPKEAADSVRFHADFGQFTEESANKEDQIRRAYAVLRTGAEARFRYSTDRAGQKIFAQDADGNRIVDIVDARTDLPFNERNYQFRLEAHLVPHNEETAANVTLDQEAALNQTRGKMAAINRPSIAKMGTGKFMQPQNMKGFASSLLEERPADFRQRGVDFRQGKGKGRAFNSKENAIQEDIHEERRVAQQKVEAEATLAALKRDSQAPHVKTYLERFGYKPGIQDSAVPCPRHYHGCEIRGKPQAIRPHWIGECHADSYFTRSEIHEGRLSEGVLCKCCTGECDICATNATICNQYGELTWKKWRAHCWSVCEPPTQDGLAPNPLHELEQMKQGRIPFTPRLFSRHRFDTNHDKRPEKNGVQHEIWCATLEEYEWALINYQKALDNHLRRKRKEFDAIDALPQPGPKKPKDDFGPKKTALPRTATLHAAKAAEPPQPSAKRAADFGQSGPQQKAQRPLLQDEIIAQYQDWENQIRDENNVTREWDGDSFTSSRDCSHQSEEWNRRETGGFRMKPRTDEQTIVWPNYETGENATWFWFPRARHRDGGWWVNIKEVHRLDPMLIAERTGPGRAGPGRGHRPRQAKDKGGKGASRPPPPPSIQRTYGRMSGRDIRDPGQWARDHEQRGDLDTASNTVSRTANNDAWQGYSNPPDSWSDDRRHEWQDRQFNRHDTRWNDWTDSRNTYYDREHQDWVEQPRREPKWDPNKHDRSYYRDGRR